MEEYLFGSARIRALETNLIGKERIEHLLETGNTERCLRALSEYGIEIGSGPASQMREVALLNRLRTAFGELLAIAPDADFLRMWIYPYDCNNIKAAIKCFRRGVDCRDMMFDFGSIPAEDVIAMAEKNDFSALPTPFSEAAAEASEAFSKTANPQWVDLILDRACYRAMLDAAHRSGEDFAIRLVRKKIDLVNIMICVRLLRMNSGEAGKAMLKNSLLEGGELPLDKLTDFFDAGEDSFWERLEYTDYRSLALSVAGAGASLTAVETAADNEWMKLIREAKMIPYGPPTLIGYFLACEYEVRNLRIILAGFGAQLPAHIVRERIRDSYV